MNEQIKQLQFQAVAQIPPLLEASEWQQEFTKKFAELIVKECADICFTKWRDNGDSYGILIKEHFGVDE